MIVPIKEGVILPNLIVDNIMSGTTTSTAFMKLIIQSDICLVSGDLMEASLDDLNETTLTVELPGWTSRWEIIRLRYFYCSSLSGLDLQPTCNLARREILRIHQLCRNWCQDDSQSRFLSCQSSDKRMLHLHLYFEGGGDSKVSMRISIYCGLNWTGPSGPNQSKNN